FEDLGDDPDLLAQAASEVLADLDLRPEARSISYGRGWEAGGVALIVRDLIDWAADLGGAIGLAAMVRSAYRRLRAKTDASGKELGDPTISLGTAQALALSHLNDRLGSVEGVQLVMGFVIGQVGPDHTGTDLFMVMFGSNSATWTYIIDSLGHLVAFAPGRPFHPNVGPVWGFDYEELPENLPTIADSEEE